MFQDIKPYEFKSNFNKKDFSLSDYIIIFNGKKFLTLQTNKGFLPPTFEEIFKDYSIIYLFPINEKSFFYYEDNFSQFKKNNFYWKNISIFKEINDSWLAFGSATAAHLAYWYKTNQYCGNCTTKLNHIENERSLLCPNCGIQKFSQISPAIMVGITNNNKILLTKYAKAEYKKYALIAGFVEIGETFEDAVKRETFEEVGLNIKNIRYYKSQPWAFSQSILIGFFAELDGNTPVSIDFNELKEATWFDKKDIPSEDSTLSLAWDMINAFKKNMESE